MQKNKKIIIYGIGRFAEYAGFLFDHDSHYTVDGYTIETSLREKETAFNPGTEFIPFEDLEKIKSPKEYDLFIAVGNNIVRERLYRSAKEKGFALATYISSRATTWANLDIGDNCFVGEGSVLQPFTKIGCNSILFSTRLGHHSTIGDHTLLSACLLGGNVNVGVHSMLGLQSSIKENTKIGARNIIGMGVIINSDTPDDAIYTAAPALKRQLTYQEFYRDLLR